MKSPFSATLCLCLCLCLLLLLLLLLLFVDAFFKEKLMEEVFAMLLLLSDLHAGRCENCSSCSLMGTLWSKKEDEGSPLSLSLSLSSCLSPKRSIVKDMAAALLLLPHLPALSDTVSAPFGQLTPFLNF